MKPPPPPNEDPVRSLDHHQQPYVYPKGSGVTDPALAAAIAYASEVCPLYGISPESLATPLAAAPCAYDPKEPVRYLHDKAAPEGPAVVFQRHELGLPVLGEGLAVLVRLRAQEAHVLASFSGEPAKYAAKPVDGAALKKALDHPVDFVIEALGTLYPKLTAGTKPTLVSSRACIARALPGRGGPPDQWPWSDLHPLPKALGAGGAAVAIEVVLTATEAPFLGGALRVRVALSQHAVLSLELPASGVTVSTTTYGWDPVTRGLAGLSPTSSAAALDAVRETIPLDITATAPLTTSRVYSINVNGPIDLPAAPYTDSIRSATGARLAAVVAADAAFAAMEDLGFTLTTYLPGQVANGRWPLPIDGSCGAAPGVTVNVTDWASVLTFGAPANTASGGVDRRVVFHEVFGHVVLLNRVGQLNLPFAHSFGDGIAAILADVDMVDRADFRTFPFTHPADANVFDTGDEFARRHDRVPTAGKNWGWGAGIHPAGFSLDAYREEQKLSSTLFRLYRALGGDSSNASVRRNAARITTWLTLKTAEGLSTAALADTPELFAGAMFAADGQDWTTMGWYGGAWHKVIRWAFEKQGLYTSPVSVETVGLPPAVDLFVANARGGEYGYASTWSTTTGIWNRKAADGGTTHQTPVYGATNYLYVKLGNRGATAAADVKVSAWLSTKAAASFPGDFLGIGKVSGSSNIALTLGAPIVPGGDPGTVVVGPFAWRPKSSYFQTILVAAEHADDRSNLGSFSAAEPISVARLVPSDNNTGSRSLFMLSKFPGFFTGHPWPRFSLPAASEPAELVHIALDAKGAELGRHRETVALRVGKPRTHTPPKAVRDLVARTSAVRLRTILSLGGVIVDDVTWPE